MNILQCPVCHARDSLSFPPDKSLHQFLECTNCYSLMFITPMPADNLTINISGQGQESTKALLPPGITEELMEKLMKEHFGKMNLFRGYEEPTKTSFPLEQPPNKALKDVKDIT